MYMKKLYPLLFSIPPFAVIFGYGGLVCFSKTGSLYRINQSFNTFENK